MRVLVTGSAGHLGEGLVQTLRQRGHEAAGLDLLQSPWTSHVECLNRMIPLGERHFRRALAEFVAHYHHERNHQGLDNELIGGTPARDAASRVSRRSRLGGLLSYYERAA